MNDSEILSVNITGLQFRNPVLTAAGPASRDGKTLIAAERGGAGGLVAKTISIKAAEVPHPNMAVLDVHRRRRAVGLTNVELWSEKPPEDWLNKEYRIAKKAGLPLIGSVGYSPEEVGELAPKMIEAGCDAIEFSMHYIEAAQEIPKAIRDSMDKEVPIFAKLSPHRPDELTKVVKDLEVHVDGFIAINSFGPTLQIDIETAKPYLGGPDGLGWMSGAALKPLAIRCVADIAKVTQKPIFGVGGVSTGKDALEHIMVGASAVQVCTAAIFEGPTIYGKIAKKMEEWLQNRNYDSVEDIRGIALGNLPSEPIRTHIIPPDIDQEKCNLCRACIKTCVYGALSIEEKKLILDTSSCEGCGLCTSICPLRAIRFSEVIS